MPDHNAPSTAKFDSASITGVAKIGTDSDTVQLVERPRHAPGAGQVTVEVHAAGVCGTDLHIAHD